MTTHYALSRAEYEREVDVALAGSFPASDPPPWTFGVPSGTQFGELVVAAPVATQVDLVIGGSRLWSVSEAIAMVALVPFGILIAGVPIAALGWAVIKAVAWAAGGR